MSDTTSAAMEHFLRHIDEHQEPDEPSSDEGLFHPELWKIMQEHHPHPSMQQMVSGRYVKFNWRRR